MDNHITSVSKSVHYHTLSCALHHIRSSITQDMATMVGTVLVGSHLDYMNSVLYGTTQENISKFPNFRKLNISWHVSCLTPTNPIPALFLQLQWPLIEYRINCKIANITFNTLHYSQPEYLHSLLSCHTPAHCLLSSNTNLLTIPFACTSLGTRSFFCHIS